MTQKHADEEDQYQGFYFDHRDDEILGNRTEPLVENRTKPVRIGSP